MAKNYSIEHVAQIYDVDDQKVREWLERENLQDFRSGMNNPFANFLGCNPKSLSGKKKNKKKGRKKDRKEQKVLKKKTVLKTNQDSWEQNFLQIKNAKYKESAKPHVDKFLRLALNKSSIEQKIRYLYDQLPTAEEFRESFCDKKYFTWQDLSFVENGLKANPNVCFLYIPIKGPTRILKDLEIEYFQKRFSKKLYKVYINRETGKLEILLSDDIPKIRKIVENHIQRPSRVLTNKTSKEAKVGVLSEIGDQKNTSRSISLDDIAANYSHNFYIQMAAKLLKRKGRAVALWENNNSIREESVLIILERKPFSFVIWENINDKRACYIFKYKSRKFDEKLKILTNFISSEMKYKRENLFRHYDVEDYHLMFDEYKAIIHENLGLYKRSMNDFISPYFVLK